MSRFHIVGSYNSTAEESDYITASTEIIIPLTNHVGTLEHGIGSALKELIKKGVQPTEDGLDILCLAALVYLADTRISRTKHSQDGWTREIDVTLPVYNTEVWETVGGTFVRMLNFLTGDRWCIEFSNREGLLQDTVMDNASFDAVSLFSGGMDSLISTINHMESMHKVALISHAGDGFTKKCPE
jgi:hypothetical protein